MAIKRKTEIKAEVASNRTIYASLSAKMRGDKNILLAALSDTRYRNYSPLQDAPYTLRDDLCVIESAIKVRLTDYNYATARIKKSPAAVCRLLKSNVELFVHLDKGMKSNLKVVSAAVSIKGSHLYYVSKTIKDNREIVSAAIKCSGESYPPLKYASARLRDDDELVKSAIKIWGGIALTFASSRIQGSSKALKMALTSRKSQYVLGGLPETVRENEKWCLLAIQYNPYAFQQVAECLKSDVAFCIAAVKRSPGCIEFIPQRMKAKSAFRRELGVPPGPAPEQVREAFQAALENYDYKSKLSGRGHAPRVSLNRKTAAALRGTDLPRVHISGYGANWYYPLSLVEAAAKILKLEISALTSS